MPVVPRTVRVNPVLVVEVTVTEFVDMGPARARPFTVTPMAAGSALADRL